MGDQLSDSGASRSGIYQDRRHVSRALGSRSSSLTKPALYQLALQIRWLSREWLVGVVVLHMLVNQLVQVCQGLFDLAVVCSLDGDVYERCYAC